MQKSSVGIRSLVVFPVILCIVILACSAEREFNIAYVGALSGDEQEFSTSTIQSMTMAIDEINSTGGLNGKNVNLVLADTQSDSIMDLVRDLIDIDQVLAAIGPESSSSAARLLSSIDDFQLPIISPAASNADLTLSSPYFFRVLPSDATQAKVLASYVYEVMGIKNLSIIATDDRYSTPLARHFESNFTLKGGVVDYLGVMPVGGQDARFYLDKVFSKGSSVLLLPLDLIELAVVLHQMTEHHSPLRVIGTDTFSRPQLFERVGAPQVEEVIYSTPPSHAVGVGAEVVDEFDRRYLLRFGEQPDNYARNAYDATRLLLTAITRQMEKNPSFTRMELRDEIAATHDFNGITGMITFDKNGDIYRGIELATIKRGLRQSLGVYNVSGGQLFRLR